MDFGVAATVERTVFGVEIGLRVVDGALKSSVCSGVLSPPFRGVSTLVSASKSSAA